MPSQPETHLACTISELQQSSCFECEILVHGEPVQCFLVYHQAQVYSYINRCPHTGVNLNWQPHQFLDISEQLIQCATHGALFRIDNGLCIRGPCLGASLVPVRHEIVGHKIYLHIDQ
ncbi:MAG: Rieske 2Fe-2S domain-containing protein [Gammaproteobacteria bacterium]